MPGGLTLGSVSIFQLFFIFIRRKGGKISGCCKPHVFCVTSDCCLGKPETAFPSITSWLHELMCVCRWAGYSWWSWHKTSCLNDCSRWRPTLTAPWELMFSLKKNTFFVRGVSPNLSGVWEKNGKTLPYTLVYFFLSRACRTIDFFRSFLSVALWQMLSYDFFFIYYIYAQNKKGKFF